jgi:hypothetical protein
MTSASTGVSQFARQRHARAALKLSGDRLVDYIQSEKHPLNCDAHTDEKYEICRKRETVELTFHLHSDGMFYLHAW